MSNVLPGMLAPPPEVTAPQVAPALHNLLVTAIGVDEPAVQRMGVDVEEWVPGFEFRPEACDQGGVWVPCITSKTGSLNPNGSGSGSGAQLKGRFDAPDSVIYVPFWVEGQFTCGTKGFQVAKYVERAQNNLRNITPKQVEHELWTGAQMAEHPSGNQNQALVTSVVGEEQVMNSFVGAAPTPVSPRVALNLLQQGLANCGTGSRGIIHATAYLAELWGNSDMLREDGARLMTKTRGTWVVSGGGYPGTGPTFLGEEGQPAAIVDNQVWVYATGLVNYRLGGVRLVPGEDEMAETIAQAMRRDINEVSYTAERPVGLSWDPCCTIAVLVDLSLGNC